MVTKIRDTIIISKLAAIQKQGGEFRSSEASFDCPHYNSIQARLCPHQTYRLRVDL